LPSMSMRRMLCCWTNQAKGLSVVDFSSLSISLIIFVAALFRDAQLRVCLLQQRETICSLRHDADQKGETWLLWTNQVKVSSLPSYFDNIRFWPPFYCRPRENLSNIVSEFSWTRCFCCEPWSLSFDRNKENDRRNIFINHHSPKFHRRNIFTKHRKKENWS
jgi:hypothetical protein